MHREVAGRLLALPVPLVLKSCSWLDRKRLAGSVVLIRTSQGETYEKVISFRKAVIAAIADGSLLPPQLVLTTKFSEFRHIGHSNVRLS